MFEQIAPAKTTMNGPLKTGLAVATAVLLLVGYRRYVDGGKGISPSIFADAVHFNWLTHAPAEAPAAPVVATNTKVTPGKRAPVSAYFYDDSGALDPFYADIEGLLTSPKNATPQITILHYGDSPTTADLITGDVREALQEKFGDGGTGYLLPGKPWAWYQHRGVDVSDKGWSISTAVGKGKEEVYGLGGARFEGGSGASSHITLKDPNAATMEVSYWEQPGGGSVAVSVNGADVETFSTAGDVAGPAWHVVKLPAEAKTVDLKPVGAEVKLFGETFRTATPGLLYDSLGLNGASTSVLSNGFKQDAWAAELKHEKPALVIINYGTNESGFGSYVDKQYEPTLRKTIERIRAALPGEPILVMSPMDRGKRTGVDEIETYDTIPRIVAIQKRVASDTGCAFFDTFDAMGGSGTMAKWYNGHPRLVAGDLIHPTPQGAGMVAAFLVKDLLTGFGRYQREHGLAGASGVSGASGVVKLEKPAAGTPVVVPGATGGSGASGSQ